MYYFKAPLSKYEQKSVIWKKLLSYYKLSNALYFAVRLKFLTLMKGLERLPIIGWVIGDKLVRNNLDKRTSQLHT